MIIPSRRLTVAAVPYPANPKGVDELREEVQRLTLQTDRLRDESHIALAGTTTAALATLAGGALSFLSATRDVGLTMAGVAGLCFAGGIGITLRANDRLAHSEAQRLAVAGDLFETRREVSRERLRQIFSAG
jgi:hypothetical protein